LCDEQPAAAITPASAIRTKIFFIASHSFVRCAVRGNRFLPHRHSHNIYL
jgi:hypothetical protein